MKRKAGEAAAQVEKVRGRRRRGSSSEGPEQGDGSHVQVKQTKGDAAPHDKRLPVTLLSGFLGSGKTTLLPHILTGHHNMKIAVVVNDMAELNIDGQVVGKIIQREAQLVQMQNGCICCTLREDLLEEVSRLAAEKRFDYLVIESTGISEPQQVAETFTFELPPGPTPDTTTTSATPTLPSTPTPPSTSNATQPPSKAKPSKAAKTTVQPNASKLTAARDHIAIPAAADVKPDKRDMRDHPDEPGKRKRRRDGAGGDGGAGGGAGGTEGVPEGAACLRPLMSVARLDTCVTVVDASCFWDNLQSIEELSDRHPGQVDAEDDRNVAALLMDQVEFADVILLNKSDLVGKKQLRRIQNLITRLNPRAQLSTTVRCKVALQQVLNTGLFTMEKASESAGWLQAINTPGGDVKSESEEYGITSFVYRSRRPFHPGRLYNDFLEKYFLTRVIAMADDDSTADDDGAPGNQEESDESDGSDESDESDESDDGGQKDEVAGYTAARDEVQRNTRQDLGNLMRSKGHCWVATQHDTCVGWSHAGAVLTMQPVGNWFAAVPEDAWPQDEGVVARIKADFDPDTGDRRQELVFIGQDLKEGAIRAALDACLASESECRDAALGRLPDPLMGEESDSEESDKSDE